MDRAGGIVAPQGTGRARARCAQELSELVALRGRDFHIRSERGRGLGTVRERRSEREVGPKGMEVASEEDDANWTEMMKIKHCGGSECAYSECRQ
jgi:hypothetical protein